MNTACAAGDAVSVTRVPCGNAAEQIVPQSTPDGWLVTTPLPAPEVETVSSRATVTNVAVTLLGPSSDTVQTSRSSGSTEHSPDQSTAEPGPGEAVSITSLPRTNDASHTGSQSIPEGALVTDPAPVSATLETDSVSSARNVAMTVVSAVITTEHGSVPGQVTPEPLQPTNTDAGAAVAVNVAWVPSSTVAEQTGPQSTAPTSAVIEPAPSPAAATEIVWTEGAEGAVISVARLRHAFHVVPV